MYAVKLNVPSARSELSVENVIVPEPMTPLAEKRVLLSMRVATCGEPAPMVTVPALLTPTVRSCICVVEVASIPAMAMTPLLTVAWTVAAVHAVPFTTALIEFELLLDEFDVQEKNNAATAHATLTRNRYEEAIAFSTRDKEIAVSKARRNIRIVCGAE